MFMFNADHMIDKNEEDWEKNKLNSNTVKFAKHYKLIKERIRNKK